LVASRCGFMDLFAVVKEKQQILPACDFEFYGCTYGKTERYNMILYITSSIDNNSYSLSPFGS